MRWRSTRPPLALAASLAAMAIPGGAQAAPFRYDSIGPIRDVTSSWRQYQPAREFCVSPDATEYAPGGAGATATGRDPACRRSGFAGSAKGLVKIKAAAPALCAGCRRLFIDFSKIPPANTPPNYYARGHVFYRLTSANTGYTVNPVAHSPNTKNFTNDKLLAPDGSPQEGLLGTLDRHQTFGYVSDTVHFIHTAVQGPYYIGPWYLSRDGARLHGVYLDVSVASAIRLPSAQLNEIGYAAGFDTGRSCPSDADGFYAGCVDWWSESVSTVNPF